MRSYKELLIRSHFGATTCDVEHNTEMGIDTLLLQLLSAHDFPGDGVVIIDSFGERVNSYEHLERSKSDQVHSYIIEIETASHSN